MEDNLKRIVAETTRLCRENNKKVDANVVAYMACLQEVSKKIEDVAPGASLSASVMTPQQVAAVSQLLAKLLSVKDSPLLATVSMQVVMESAFKQQRELIEREQAEKTERVDMLARALLGPKPLRDTSLDAYERMYKRVQEYVAVAGGLELATTDDVAAQELRAAMESVFPLSTLARFLTLPDEERLQQVEELARMTVGICLYNRSVGKGGYALPPGAATYLPQAQRLLRDLQRHAADAASELRSYAALMRTFAPGEGGDPHRARAAQEALHRAQGLVLLEALQSDLESGLDAVQQLEAELQHCLAQSQDSVGGSTAVPKDLILPVFERLGAIHSGLADELRLLVVRQRLFDELTSHLGGYVTLLQREAKARRPGRKTPSEEALVNMQPEARLEDLPPMSDGVEYCVPSPSQQQQPPHPHEGASTSSAIPDLALSGFDPVVLAKEGFLRRCNPALGFLSCNGARYGFATSEHMRRFAAEPAAIAAQVTTTIGRQPVLARLLGRQAGYPQLDLQQVLTIMAGPLKVDFGTQTPVHFVERHIDTSYEWNVWALRRRALALANLRTKRTHSTQTALTHFKRDAESQVWQPKEAQIQTRVNKGQTMPKKLQYVAGLRGAPNTKMNVVRLELELGQPHQH